MGAFRRSLIMAIYVADIALKTKCKVHLGCDFDNKKKNGHHVFCVPCFLDIFLQVFYKCLYFGIS